MNIPVSASRRQFLKGSAALGLVVGFHIPLAQRALAAGFRIDQGYGPLQGKAFRIGHMGDHTAARLDALLAAL